MKQPCSCIICKQQFSHMGINSHFLALHTKEGNERVKKSGKLGSQAAKPKKEFVKTETTISYNSNPNFCLQCNSPLPYNIRNNKFCNHSCAGKCNNAARKENGWSLSRISRNKISKTLKSKNPKEKRITKISFCIICNSPFAGFRKTCTKTCLDIFYRQNALKNSLGANSRRNSKILIRLDSFGKSVRLESSYEIKFAELLDELRVNWIRPNPFPWIDSIGLSHKYYPDFYLPDHNIYFDPKNKFNIKTDEEKISRVIEQNNIIVHILPIEKINEQYIKSLLFLSPD